MTWDSRFRSPSSTKPRRLNSSWRPALSLQIGMTMASVGLPEPGGGWLERLPLSLSARDPAIARSIPGQDMGAREGRQNGALPASQGSEPYKFLDLLGRQNLFFPLCKRLY